MAGVLDQYNTTTPSHQNSLDIFSGLWTSRLPASHSHLVAGALPLFEDPRVTWAIEKLGGLSGKEVLELGPLEGAHSYMMEQAGVKSVLALESNTSSFVRCLIIKEILTLSKVRYFCGDFRPFLDANQHCFDLIFASGVLYHMTDPMRLLREISRSCRQVFLWTHYYDAPFVERNDYVRNRLGPAQHLELDGLSYEMHSFAYDFVLESPTYCGGTAPTAAWLTKDSILRALGHFGFKTIDVGFEHPEHPNGPAFAVVGSR